MAQPPRGAGVAGAEPQAGIIRAGGGQSAGAVGWPVRLIGQSPAAGKSAPAADWLAGTETMERMRALQTPLQQTTVGSGRRLNTHT